MRTLRRAFALLVLPAAFALPAAASAATFTVNGTGDAGDASLADGLCDSNLGTAGLQCTLRAAIQQANNDATADTIGFAAAFDGPGGGTSDVIALGSSLPAITQPASIDGGNCGTATAPEPCAEVASTSFRIVRTLADDTSFRGLAIVGASDFSNGVGIDVTATAGSVTDRASITNVWFGLRLSGALSPNHVGLHVAESADVTVGGGTPADRNVFAANDLAGLGVDDSDRTTVTGNYFGTLADGTTATATATNGQIQVSGVPGAGGEANATTIGGPDPGTPSVCDGPCNVIVTPAGGAGIKLDTFELTAPSSLGTAIEGNFLGLGASGAEIGTGSIDVGHSDGTTIGGDASRRNYILGDVLDSVGLGLIAEDLTVADNFLGTDPAGAALLESSHIRFDASGTLDDARILRNVVGAGTAGTAIGVQGTDSVIQGNSIGVGTGGGDIGGGDFGIAVTNGANHQIGGAAVGQGNLIGNADAGVFVQNGADSTTVAGNLIGTDAAGTASYPLALQGVIVQADNAEIGGAGAAAENVISNAAGGAIEIMFDGDDGNEVLRNRGSGNGAGQPFVDLNPLPGPGISPTAPNAAIPTPAITGTPTAASITGTGQPGATVRVYRTLVGDGGVTKDLAEFVGQTTVNGSGDWTLSCPSAGCSSQIQGGDRVAATETDAAGNTSETSAAKGYTDLPPETSITGGPAPGGSSNASPTFTFDATEAGSTFECRIYAGTTPSGSFGPCNGPAGEHTPPAPLPAGQMTFEVRATDASALTDASPASRTFTVDLTAPDTSVVSGPSATPTADATPTFGFSATEPGSSFECRIDGAAFVPCGGPGATHTTPKLADGPHTFAVRATDAVGNLDPTPATRAFRVDTDPPETTLTKQPKAKTKKRKAKLTFAADEAGATFQCSLDGSAFAPCGSAFAKRVKPGRHVFAVRATDVAGNADPTPATARWKVKRKRKRR